VSENLPSDLESRPILDPGMMVSQQKIGDTTKGMHFALARSTNGDSYPLWVERFFCSAAHRLRMG